LLILLLQNGYSQSIITGIVRDNRSPVIGASVALKDSYDGATSDSTGRFRFRTTEKGNQVLMVSAIGYKSAEIPLKLDGLTQNINVVLKEEINEMKAVV